MRDANQRGSYINQAPDVSVYIAIVNRMEILI